VAVAAASIAAVAVVGIVLGGGEASASRAEYQDTVVVARNRVELALAKIAKVQSLAQLLASLDDASVAADTSAAELGEAGVADGFGDENDTLVTALSALAFELSGTAETMRDPNFAAALPKLNSLSFPQWEVVNSVLTDLEEQGIEVEPLARH